MDKNQEITCFNQEQTSLNKEKKCLNIALDLCSDLKVKNIIVKERFGDEKLDVWPWGGSEKEAITSIMDGWSVPLDIREKLYYFIVIIGMKLLRWTEYNYRIFGLPYEQSRDVIKRSLLTEQGTVDQVAAARDLVINENISSFIRFKIASTFQLKENILALYIKIPDFIKNQINQSNISEPFIPLLTKSWLNIWNGRISLALYAENMFEGSIITGNWPVLKCLLHLFNYFSLKEIRLFIFDYILSRLDPEREWNDKSLKFERMWIPKENYINLFINVFSNAMDYEINELFYNREETICLFILKELLEWPYQKHFFEYSRYMWNAITVHGFVEVLMCIINKIRMHNHQINTYGFHFRKFWLEAPDEFKKYVCRENVNGENYSLKIFVNIFKINPFRDIDVMNVNLMLRHMKLVNFLKMEKDIAKAVDIEGNPDLVRNFQEFSSFL